MSEFCALPSHTDLCGTCRWTDEGLLPTREESTLRATVQDELTVQLAQLALQRQEDDHYHAMEVDNAQAQVDPEQQEVLANIYDVGGQGQAQPQAQVQPQAQAQVDPAPQALQQEQPQAQAQVRPWGAGAGWQGFLAARAERIMNNAPDPAVVAVQRFLQEAELRREQRNLQRQEQAAALGAQEIPQEIAQAVDNWAHAEAQRDIVQQILGEQFNVHVGAQAQVQPQEQPQE